MSEFWDAYDAEMNPLEGVVLKRDEKIPEGIYHLICEVLVRHTDGTYLIMKRDARKNFGGYWEATAGGSALRGETPEQCAVRELREETGVVTDTLTELGRSTFPQISCHYIEYLCITDVDKECITLQEGETSDYRWVTEEELMNMGEEELIHPRIREYIKGDKVWR